MVLAFLDCRLDIPGHELRRNGQVVDVEPQVFDTLAYLVAHRERMVRKTELLDEIWGDRFVSESALTTRIKTARRAIGDDGRTQRAIKTVHGRGYRFVADVAEEGGHEPGVGPAEPVVGDDPCAWVLGQLDAGKGVALSIEGPSGAGKSDLLAEVVDLARERGFLVGSGSSALAHVRQLGAVMDALDEVTQLAPELLEQIPDSCSAELRRWQAGERSTTHARQVLAARELLQAATSQQPTVLALDDVHVGGESTRRLVRLLAPMTRRRPLAILVAHPEPIDFGPFFQEVTLDAGPTTSDSGYQPTLPAGVSEALAAVALAGERFDRLDLEVAAGADEETIAWIIDAAVTSGTIAVASAGYRFSDLREVERLVESLRPSERLALSRRMAEGLAARHAPPERVAGHFLAAGDRVAAVTPALQAARAAMASHAYADARRWIDAVIDVAPPPQEFELQLLEADALAAVGDLDAIAAYRRLIDRAPVEQLPAVRTKLARSAMLSGDVATAAESLQGLEPDGGPNDGALLLAQGMLAFFQGDMEGAERAMEGARVLAFSPGAPARLMDAITLQGLISHSAGEWFDRLHREMRTTHHRADLLTSVFDAHLCVAEYLLYGPTPYDEVLDMARSLADAASEVGANPAVAFALAVSGEAALLAGDLELARADLDRALALNREMGAVTGQAHTLQRLAEVENADGNRAAAHQLARRALVIGRWSPLAQHLVQRAYGTIIATSPTADDALAVAREAADLLDEPTYCEVCNVMAYVPMAAAFADAGHVDEARWAMASAEQSAQFWEGSAWPAALAEARACIARAEGDQGSAAALLERAARMFTEAGQPLDAARCREALVDLTEAHGV